MRIQWTAVMGLLLLTAPAMADKKLDEAVAKAEEQLQKGKPEDALKTMQKAVDSTPGPEALLALARLQERIGGAESLDAAAASLSKAVETSAAAAPVLRAQALAAQASMDLCRGSSKAALEHAQDAVKAQATPEALAALARAQARSADPNEALKTADGAVQAAATSGVAHEARGDALLALHRSDDAVAAYRKALEVDPKLNRARVGLASALLAQGKAAEAVTEARKASEANAQSAEAFAVLGAALLAQDPKNWNDAIAQAQQGAFLNPKSPAVHLAVGRIFESSGNLDQAATHYKQALEGDPGYTAAQVALVQILVRQGSLDKALPEARKLAAAAPTNGEAHLLLGRILAGKGDFLAAVEPLEKAAAALPGSAEAHALLGTALQYARRSEEALKAYQKAVALAPQNNDFRSTYGLLLGLNKQYEAAAAELKKVVAAPGYRSTAGWTNLGWVYRNMEPSRSEDSVAAYKKAFELEPKNEQAALGMGWAYSNLKRYDDAVASFRKAIELEPKTAGEAYNGIAWCYYFKKDFPQAKAAGEKAKAEGRNMASLFSNINKIEKGQVAAAEEAERAFREAQKAKEEPDIGTLGNTLMRPGAPAPKIKAAQGLVHFGHAGVEFLIFAAVNDKDFSVREASINALGAMGAAAKDQCAQLKGIADSNPYDKVVQDKKEMELSMAYGDLQRAARAARQKIGCN